MFQLKVLSLGSFVLTSYCEGQLNAVEIPDAPCFPEHYQLDLYIIHRPSQNAHVTLMPSTAWHIKPISIHQELRHNFELKFLFSILINSIDTDHLHHFKKRF